MSRGGVAHVSLVYDRARAVDDNLRVAPSVLHHALNAVPKATDCMPTAPRQWASPA